MACELLTLDEFKSSPFNDALVICSAPSGDARDAYIEGLIQVAQESVVSFLGWDICMQPRKDITKGDDSNTYFLDFLPVNPTGTIEINYKQIMRNNLGSSISGLNGFITDFYLADDRTGQLRFPQGFLSGIEYMISYESGFSVIPDQIKLAVKLLVLSYGQRLDNQQLSNPDFNLAGTKVDRSIGVNFGNSGLIKQIILKNISELNDLPITVLKLLQRFKR